MPRVTFALFLLLATSGVLADELPLTREEIAIPPGQTRSFEFGTIPQQGTTALLEVVARLHYEKPSGSNYFLKMTLDGHEIQPARSRGVMRLVNKPLISPVAANLPASWFGNGAFRLLYAPDFECGRKISCYVDDPYTFVLDVTDLTNPAAENRLQLTNIADPNRIQGKPPAGNLVLRRLTIHTRPGPSPMMASRLDATPILNSGQPAAGPARYRGEVRPGGGFCITVGRRRWEFASTFSYPAVTLASLPPMNRLTPGASVDRSGQPGWTANVRRADHDGGEVVAAGPDYRLRRTIRFTAGKVEIADQLTNAHRDAPLGLAVRHQVDLAGLKDPPIRLAGNPDPAGNDYYSPPNPSVHVALADQGLGLLCEDDVFRNQARLFYNESPPAAGLRTDMLRLAPGESYTLRWSVYPVAGPDYYDFINLVRNDWGSNITLDGAWTFFHPDSILAQPLETIRRQFARLGIRYACYCGGWVDPQHDRRRIGFGTGVLDDYWADFRRRLREATARIHAASPGTKVLVYYDTQRDTSEGGHARYRDSWLTDRAGNQLSTNWSGVYSQTYSVVATLDNAFGRAMLAAVDRYFDAMHVDGLYWDEMEAVGYGMPLLTYNQPDGHSCLLDPRRFTIEREVGITTLLGEGHRLAVIQRARRHGGTVMGNGPAFTRALLASGVQRMVEIQHNDSWCFEGNLGTPLGYMSSRTDFGNFARALQMPCLPVGTRYDYPSDISRYLFPLTPVELHHGYLLGKERIVALHPGDYGWPDQRCLVQVRPYDRDGNRVDAAIATRIGREARTAIAPADGEAVVLERLPITLTPEAGEAEVSAVRYSSTGLTLRLSASHGAELRIADGPFPVHTDRHYMVQIGEQPPQPVVVDRGALCVTLGPARNVRVSVAGSRQ